MRTLSRSLVLLVVAGPLLLSHTAVAQSPSECATGPQVVVMTLPGITWADVARWKPPAIMGSVQSGSIGSIVVRTISSRTSYASGFATIGAGARVDGGRMSGGPAYPYDEPEPVTIFDTDVKVAGLDEIRRILDDSGYSTVVPGALSEALRPSGRAIVSIGNADPGIPVPSPLGYGRWTLLAGMDERGRAPATGTDASLIAEDPDAPFGVRTEMDIFDNTVREGLRPCLVPVIDQGDLTRSDMLPSTPEAKRTALMAADRTVAVVSAELDPERDLLVIVSPTSPLWDETVHFGVAIAVGPGFPAGSSLASATSRRDAIVTLPDVAPTVLEFLGVEVPASMLGRGFDTVDMGGDRIATALELDDESTFVDSIRTPISTGFVIFQLFVYSLVVWLLTRREQRRGIAMDRRVQGLLEAAALALAAFPLVSYLMGLFPAAHGLGGWGYTGVLVVGDIAAVAVVMVVLDGPLDRLLAIAGATLAGFILDLLVGAPLQVNTVFSYSLIVAGRLAGIGNIGFAILGASAVLTGTLIVHRWRDTRWALPAVAALFAITVVVDGAPQFGSDVGGALALVPGLGITWLLLSGRRLRASTIFTGLIAAVVVLAVFLAVDLSRPPEQQTHLARLYNDVRAQGAQVFFDTIGRKVSTNLRVFRSTIWTFVVPAALALLAWLLLWPRDRWRALSDQLPKIRAGLLGGLVLAVLGFAVNDSGIVIPAMMFAYLVPVALLAHLTIRPPGEVHGDG